MTSDADIAVVAFAVAKLLNKNWVSLAVHEQETIKYLIAINGAPELIADEIRRQRKVATIIAEMREQDVKLDEVEREGVLSDMKNGMTEVAAVSKAKAQKDSA